VKPFLLNPETFAPNPVKGLAGKVRNFATANVKQLAGHDTGISENRMRQWQLVYHAGDDQTISVSERSPFKVLNSRCGPAAGIIYFVSFNS
jgi:hypothetical protein